MSEVIELSIDDDSGHLVEPPIVDSLVRDDGRAEWIVGFVPEESVSKREKERVVLPYSSSDGRRVRLRVERLERLLGAKIDRIFHSGGGDFTFHTASGTTAPADQHLRIVRSMRAYVELTDIAMTAQIAFAGVAGAAS